MRPLRALILSGLCLTPSLVALGQGPGSASTPMAVDLKKVAVGSWSEYSMSMGRPELGAMKSRWSLVARDAKSSTIEMTVEGSAIASVGGKMVVKSVLVPDPVNAEKPVKEMIVKMGDRDPMRMPLDLPGMPTQRFEKPSPKNLVAREQIKVAAGPFTASHFREVTERGTIDSWVNEEVGPLGVVKVITSPKPGTLGPDGQPLSPVTMELTARGKDAKPLITQPAKPFDPTAFGRPPAPPAAPEAPAAPAAPKK